MTRLRYLMAPLLAATFLLAGCGGSGDLASGSAADAPAAARGEADSGTAERQLAEPVRPVEGDTSSEAGKDSTSGSDITIAPVPRAVIYTAELTVRAKDVGAAADAAKRLVTEAGGYVAEEKSNSFSSSDQAVITFKIPPARYPAVLDQLGKTLGKREALHQGTQDVTGEVADVEARLKSAQSALDQFRLLLTKANKIGEIMEIEREIQSRTADLEALQARQKALAEQTGMATVTMTLVGPSAVIEKPKPEPTGFLPGLKAGWKALLTAGTAGLTILGTLLPWLVVLGALWAFGALVLRRVRPRPTRPITGEKAAADRSADRAGDKPSVERADT